MRRVWNRPMGSGACERSATCTPALTIPLISPRFSMRLERCWSRFMVIVAPSFSVVKDNVRSRPLSAGKLTSTLIR